MKSVVSITRLASIKSRSSTEVTAHDRSQTASRGFLAAALANLIWGMSFLASKYTLLSWGPLTASAIRFALATLALFLFAVISGKRIHTPKSWATLGKLFILALAGFGLLYPLQLAGLKHISSGMSSAIMLLSPLLVLIFARIISGDAFNRYKMGAVCLGIIGGSILCLAQPSNISSTQSNFINGVTLTLLAAGALAISAVLTRQLSTGLDSLSITFWSMLIGAMMLIAAAVAWEGNSAFNVNANAAPVSWIAVVFLATVCSALCFFLWNYALSVSPASEIASTMHIKTPTAIILGVALAGETITPTLIIGSSIVAIAVWLSQQSSKVRKL